MVVARLEDRFRAALGATSSRERDEQLRFGVEFCRLLARALPDEVSPEARSAMDKALTARTDLLPQEIAVLLDLALAPENRTAVEEDELRAFGARFGMAEAEALRAVVSDDVDLPHFAEKHGSAEALLLLDALFAVCAVDGSIEPEDLTLLQRAAQDLGIDEMLVGALFRKHDPRYAKGDFRFNLTQDRYTIGRSAAASIQLPDPQIALKHAELVRSAQGGWRIVDLASGRPTLINGNSVSSAPFRAGDSLRVGPYTLALDKDEAALTAFGQKAFSALSVRNLDRKIGDVVLLDGVSFTVFSGEVIAVVGPSGGGKTTLLNAIAGIALADTGDVLLDGQDFHALLAADRSVVGIVPQDDVVMAELTVEESLYYSGRLRFAKDVSREAIGVEVDRVLSELSISHIRGSRIGDQLRRGVSGGQRKRVSLGQELLTRSTKVLFLDEPTSGLDPQTAQDIVQLVRQLADDGRIIFIVTHDVTPSVMSMIDHLIVLAPGGRLAWFGPPEEACIHFGVRSCDEIFARLPDNKPADWSAKYRASAAFRKYVRTREHLLGLDGVSIQKVARAGPVQRSAWLQYATLTRRYAKAKMRDRMGLFVLLAQAPILALAMRVVFPEPDHAMMFMLVLSALWFGASGSVRELIADRAVFRREHRVGLGVVPYIASKVTVLGAIAIVQCLVLSLMTGAMLGLFSSEYGYSPVQLGLVTSLTGLVGMSLGLFVSSLFNSSEAAVGTLPLLLIPQITFGGLVVTVKEMPLLAKKVSWLMITRYAYEAAIKTGDALTRPGEYGKERTTLPLSGVLWQLGFKEKGTSADDLGLSLTFLCLALVAFLVTFLVGATTMTARTESSG